MERKHCSTLCDRVMARSRETNCLSLSSAVLGVMWNFSTTTPLREGGREGRREREGGREGLRERERGRGRVEVRLIVFWMMVQLAAVLCLIRKKGKFSDGHKTTQRQRDGVNN